MGRMQMNISEWDFGGIVQGALGAGFMSLGLIPLFLKKFLDKWVSASFDRKQETWKDERTKEMKLLEADLNIKLSVAKIELEAKNALEKQNIQAALDYAVKRSLHYAEVEYKVIPEAWRLTIEAIQAVNRLLNVLRPKFELSRLTQVELEDFLEGKAYLKAWHQEDMKACSPEKRNEMWEKISLKALEILASEKHSIAKSYIDLHAIYMNEGLIKNFVEALDHCSQGRGKWFSQQMHMDWGPKSEDSVTYSLRFLGESRRQQNILEAAIRSHLKEKTS